MLHWLIVLLCLTAEQILLLASRTSIAWELQPILHPSTSSGTLWNHLMIHELPELPCPCSWKRLSVMWSNIFKVADLSSMITSSTPDFLFTSTLIWYLVVPGSFFWTYWDTSLRSSTTWEKCEQMRGVLMTTGTYSVYLASFRRDNGNQINLRRHLDVGEF